MIKNWIVTGDTHCRVESRLHQIYSTGKYRPAETAVIILGDAGLNYWLNDADRAEKERSSAMGFRIYCVRGNHEQRPQNVPGMMLIDDADVGGKVYMEKEFPLIRYFVDGGEYTIKDYSVLTIGGAYSVDKPYRLARAAGRGFSGWFAEEQLSENERADILKRVAGKQYDFVFTHTAPAKWEPTDLFLPGIDQSSVDKTMELWLQEVSEAVKYKYWLFAHFHADRLERPHVEQYFHNWEELDNIIERWKMYDTTGKLDWRLLISPNFR